MAMAMIQNVWETQLSLVVSSSCAGLKYTMWRAPPLAAYSVKNTENVIVSAYACSVRYFPDPGPSLVIHAPW